MKLKMAYFVAALSIAGFALASCGTNKKLTKENQDLNANLEATRARVAQLEEELKAKNVEIEELSAQIQSKNEELLSLRDELAQTQAEARDLEISVVSKEDEKGGLATQVETLEGDLRSAQRHAEDLEGRIGDLERDIDSRNEELERLRGERDEIDAQLAELYAEIESLRQRNSALEEEVVQLRTRSEEDKDRMETAYESLLSDLREEIGQKTVEIQRYKDALTINIMNHIFFDSGKANIKPEGYSVLDRIANIVKDVDDKIIKIEGHTDDVPIGPRIKSKYPTNWELGAARSSAVARYLIGKHDIDPTRVVVVSYAFYRPLLPNTSEANRAKNRRIEIVLTQRELYELVEIDEDLKVE